LTHQKKTVKPYLKCVNHYPNSLHQSGKYATCFDKLAVTSVAHSAANYATTQDGKLADNNTTTPTKQTATQVAKHFTQ